MIKNTVSKLYEFITKMMLLLESDLENIASADKELKLKRNITSILNRLVAILLQLNKLSKEEQLYLADSLPEEDLEIIERFVAKYRSESSSRASEAMRRDPSAEMRSISEVHKLDYDVE